MTHHSSMVEDYCWTMMIVAALSFSHAEIHRLHLLAGGFTIVLMRAIKVTPKVETRK